MLGNGRDNCAAQGGMADMDDAAVVGVSEMLMEEPDSDEVPVTGEECHGNADQPGAPLEGPCDGAAAEPLRPAIAAPIAAWYCCCISSC